ncbi:hypothetical protein HERIO_874 [Hepatospora eriocheir]|uniref:ISXO2-like transposase domain-containing protein n=1 Tax=Hepatospora eriocheir TaxID=1081669 RepID=A0A1X0QBU3_9MICR|nr:hypothetical protein HERIO_874 [Hepatospora eriocheir]
MNKKSVIVSYEWKANNGLNSYFHDFNVVNHSENFTDQTTSCNIQLIESVWSHVKLEIKKNKRRTVISLL